MFIVINQQFIENFFKTTNKALRALFVVLKLIVSIKTFYCFDYAFINTFHALKQILKMYLFK
ncbi:hypothetical protein OY14_04530 (plasmid) [Borreliella chilensis]|uniref:Uncharacterized protein n=1 Tax=Borreliella chilensis TaxID=1245910 RepID=A0A0A7UX96_9SPIR|nr:hypothetical protein OY14_04530 [Borreliella chilensis]